MTLVKKARLRLIPIVVMLTPRDEFICCLAEGMNRAQLSQSELNTIRPYFPTLTNRDLENRFSFQFTYTAIPSKYYAPRYYRLSGKSHSVEIGISLLAANVLLSLSAKDRLEYGPRLEQLASQLYQEIEDTMLAQLEEYS